MNPVEYFNKNNREKYWSKNEEKYKRWFKKQLKHLLVEIEEESTEKELASFMWRLGLGYWGVGTQKGIPSGIYTESCKNTKKCTEDHVFGVVEIGKYVHKKFKESDYNIDYMVNEWLYDNLYLWMTIKVSKEEHKKDNIIRNDHTIEEKKEFKHYKNVSSFILI